MKFSVQTEFTDGKILIRPYRVEDIPLLYQAARESITQMQPWMPWCHANYSLEECTKWIQSRQPEWDRGDQYSFAIFDCGNGRFLGGTGINFINHIHQFANLGYWIRSGERKRGVATAAARLAAQFAFEELKLQRLEIITAIGNDASERVAQKVGAVREGVLRNRLLLNGRIFGAVMYSLVPGNLKSSSI